MKASSMKQLCIEEFSLPEKSVRTFAADIFGMVIKHRALYLRFLKNEGPKEHRVTKQVLYILATAEPVFTATLRYSNGLLK